MSEYDWLKAHCDLDRETLARPWAEAGRTWATQRYYLVSVPGEHAPPRSAAPLPADYHDPVGGREPDARVDLRLLVGRDHTRACTHCRPGPDGGRMLACRTCEGSGLHACPTCDADHSCGHCDGTGSLGSCDCTDGRIERHDVVVRVAGVVVDAAYLVRLAPHLGLADVWGCEDKLFLRGPADVRALIMGRVKDRWTVDLVDWMQEDPDSAGPRGHDGRSA